ncbi:MAG TPA: GNAT family N-acetyltransferase [Gemmatimonadaceae bacterium]|nr:GNAT family N-acetyltransferase [Gemmatimonadaceae bacterium]
MEINIRLATAADAVALAQLRYEFRAAMDPAQEEEAAFAARCADWMRRHLESAQWRAWVAATDAGELVGTLWLALIEKVPNPVAEPEEHAYLTNVFVRPAARGAGVGSALLREAIAWCAQRGIDTAFLWPSSRSVPWYGRHGFAQPPVLLERDFRSVRTTPGVPGAAPA